MADRRRPIVIHCEPSPPQPPPPAAESDVAPAEEELTELGRLLRNLPLL